MAMTLTRVTRTVTTDYTVAATAKAATVGIGALVGVLSAATPQQLKATEIAGLAGVLNHVLSGTDYTTDLMTIFNQAVTVLGQFRPITGRNKELLDAACAANALMYAESETSIDVNSDPSLLVPLWNLSMEDLELMRLFLRFKGGI